MDQYRRCKGFKDLQRNWNSCASWSATVCAWWFPIPTVQRWSFV